MPTHRLVIMDKTFDPKRIETRWASRWEARGYFSPSNGDAQTHGSYCIVIPPPNVTGSLHMGHAFQDTIMDMLVRFHRMRGDNTLWQVGTDHAGIATQMVVERQLAAEGSSGRDIGREAFVDRIWRWRTESGGHITRQLRRLGASVDWSREAFTMDDNLSRAVTDVFVRLFDEGLIYRGKRLVNWDPVLRTAVSDLEVISEAEQGHIWHLRYPIVDSADHLIVATTRPETMLGDTAVAVHPDDQRYRHLIGRRVRLPLTERTIPIIADDYVDREFGTGCLKITPAHDFNDHAVGQRHDLDVINVLTEDARINDAAPAAYRGLSREQARERVVADLEVAGLLDKVAPHALMVPRGDRTGSVIEPYLTNQWFVHAKPLAEPAIRAVEDGRIRFVPENWAKTYFEWMRNIQDWCISRQIWWGHRIPAWYDAAGNLYVGRDESQARERAGLAEDVPLERDPDVLDTWFSSALWPFSTLGWPERTPEMATFYPTSVLVTGFDIIFFWVARMIMMGLKFTGEVPFREVYVHGLVRDADGQKMSKSKGNVLDPIDLIDGIGVDALVEKRTRGLMQPHKAQAIEHATRKEFPHGIAAFGTDALRFTFAALASNGRDIRFDLGRVAGYRNFCNKLWNAARYVRMQTEAEESAADDHASRTRSVIDRWIVSRLQRTESAVIRHMHSYRFDMAAKALYEFIWHEYCDWYLEMSKPVLQNRAADDAHAEATRRTLVGVLDALLRLAHPFMPFITEEIWQSIGPLAGRQGETITLQPLPQPDSARIDANAEAEVEWIQGFILGVRQIRGEMDIAPGKRVPVLLVGTNGGDRRRLAEHAVWLHGLAQVDNIRLLDNEHATPESATALLGHMRILVPMAGIIDKTEELNRLQKQIDKLDKELARSRGKLDNKQFTERAPVEVVHKERRRLNEMTRSREDLQAQRERIAAV